MSETQARKQKRVVLRDEGQEQLLKFSIGLKLLGEQKSQRLLAFMLTLQEKSVENGQQPKE
jgi:hypothetical protein